MQRYLWEEKYTIMRDILGKNPISYSPHKKKVSILMVTLEKKKDKKTNSQLKTSQKNSVIIKKDLFHIYGT